jgi:hypothetical protein
MVLINLSPSVPGGLGRGLQPGCGAAKRWPAPVSEPACPSGRGRILQNHLTSISA